MNKFVLFGLLLALMYFPSIMCKSMDYETRISKLENLAVRQEEILDRLEKTNMKHAEKIHHFEEMLKIQNEQNKQLRLEMDALKSGEMNFTSCCLDYVAKHKNDVKHREERHQNSDHHVLSVQGRKKRLSNRFESTIAFYAYMSGNVLSPSKRQTLIFDKVITNIGNGYNHHAGIFVAVVPGVYVFSYSLFGSFRARIPVEIVVNSNVVGSSRCDSNTYNFDNSASNTIVVILKAGDICFTRTHSNISPTGSLISRTDERCSFSGWKISH